VSDQDLILIAGGMGSRMASKFPGVPKALLEIGELTLLERLLREIPHRNAYLSLGHGAEKIIQHLGELGNTKKIGWFIEPQPVGSFGGLKLSVLSFKEKLSSAVTVVLADVFVHAIARDLGRIGTSQHNIVFFAKNDHPHDSDRISIDCDGVVTDFYKKTEGKSDKFSNKTVSGIYQFLVKDILAYSAEAGDIGTDFLPHLAEQKALRAIRMTGVVKDAGTPERFDSLSKFEKSGKFIHQDGDGIPCVFMDFDGTIIKDRGSDYHFNLPPPVLNPEIVSVIEFCNKNFIPVIVITNQGDLAKGFKTEEQLLSDFTFVEKLLAQENVWLDDIYWCPHYPEGGYPGEVKSLKVKCNCRKPKPGLLTKSAANWGIDLSASIFVGDTQHDEDLAGSIPGMKFVKIKAGQSISKCSDGSLLFDLLERFRR